MHAIKGMQKFKRYFAIFLLLAALLVLYAAIIPVEAQQCRTLSQGQFVSGKIAVGNPTVTPQLLSCSRSGVATWKITTIQKYEQKYYHKWRNQCYCSQTHRWEWNGGVYQDADPFRIITTYTTKVTRIVNHDCIHPPV